MPAAGVKVLYSLSTLSLRSWKDFCTTGDNSSRHHRYHPSTALQVSTVHGSTGIIPPQPSRYQQFTALQVSSLHSPPGINSSRHYRYYPSTALQVSTVHGTTGIIPPQPYRYQQFTGYCQVCYAAVPYDICVSDVSISFFHPMFLHRSLVVSDNIQHVKMNLTVAVHILDVYLLQQSTFHLYPALRALSEVLTFQNL